jgi:hypothetical protein
MKELRKTTGQINNYKDLVLNLVIYNQNIKRKRI